MQAYMGLRALTRTSVAGAALLGIVVLALGGCPAATPQDGVVGGEVSNQAPTFVFLQPTENVTAYAGQTVTLTWYDDDPDDNATIKLYYDVDRLAGTGDEVLLTTTMEDPDGAGGDSYVWDLTGVEPGTYNVLAVVDDGTNPPITVYLPATITVESSVPRITVVEPSYNLNVLPAQNVVIKWTDYAPLSNADVRLFYDDDNSIANGFLGTIATLKEDPDGEGDSYVWNVPAIPAGAYYIGATIEDGIHPAVTAYGAGVVNISGLGLTFRSPTVDTHYPTTSSVRIWWDDTAPASNADVTIFYDTNTNYNDGVTPITTVKEDPDGNSDQFVWQPQGLAEGIYYIGGKLDDGVNEPLIVYAPGRLLVGDVGGADQPPTIAVTSPSGAMLVSAGEVLMIAWNDTASGNASIELFYDDDTDPTNGTTLIVAGLDEDPDGPGSDDYAWTIPGGLSGGTQYYIGATIDDGTHPPVTAYSSGTFEVLDRHYYTTALEDLDPERLGRTFRGRSPHGRLGGVPAHIPWQRVPHPTGGTRLTPGISMNGNAYDDFALTAPKGDAWNRERWGCGETYLILSDPAVLFPARAYGPIDVWATATTALPGVIFSGPAATDAASSSGIRAVALSRDADRDGIPDLVFGVPHVAKIVQEQQDYDPWDNYEYLVGGAGNFGEEEFVVDYSDGFRVPGTGTARNPEGTTTDYTGWEEVTAGMMVAVSGNIPALQTQIGSPMPQQVVVALDNVGQPAVDPHPTVVNGTLPGGLRGPNGVRFYCPWWFSPVSGVNGDRPAYAEHKGGPFVSINRDIQTQQDDSYFAESVIEADLDGDGYPDWIATQPFDPDLSNGTGLNEGWLHVIWSDKTTLWNAPYGDTTAPGAWQNGGWVRIDNVTINAEGATRTNGTPSAPPPYSWGAWSWPYAFTQGNVIIVRTEDQTQDPAVVTWTVESDTRDRWYCWPVVSDYVRGDGTEAPNGHLGGLANVGDFNGDYREDITVGAPNANPNNLDNAGCVYLIFGRANFGDHSLNTIGKIAPGALAGIKIVGEAAGDRVGTVQASAGDFNGDGFSDWLIGIPDRNGGQGVAAVVYGSDFLQGSFSISDIGTPKLPGVLFVGEFPGVRAGAGVAGVGDVDGDGYDDIVVIAPQMDWTFGDSTDRIRPGVAYLIYGGPNHTGVQQLADVGTGAVAGRIYVGPQANAPLGTVAPAGDVDGDGFADFLIGNPNYNGVDPDGNVLSPEVGEVYLIRGGPRSQP